MVLVNPMLQAHSPNFLSLYITLPFCGFISITARNLWTTPILWKLLPQSQTVCPCNLRGAASNYVIGED